MKVLNTTDELDALCTQEPALAVYFGAPGCGVCTVLKPKLESLFASEFPQLAVAEVDCEASPALAASCSVFAVPSLVLFFDGHEGSRFSRSFGLAEVREALARPYRMLFPS